MQKYRKELGLRAVLAIRAPYTTKGHKEHPIYSYKLKGLEITRANQVWSTDISYIRIKGGFVYMAAIYPNRLPLSPLTTPLIGDPTRSPTNSLAL